MLILSILLSLLLFGLPLYGKRVLSALPGDYDIRADRVGGPLWRPTLQGATISGPGIRARASELSVSVASLNPFSREVRLSGTAKGAVVDLDLKRLLSGERRSNWRVLPQDFALQDVRVNLDNSGYNLPNASVSASGRDGQLRIQATTRFGGARAEVRYAPQGGQLRGEADLRLDATLVNALWNGVRGGVVAGRYTFGDGGLRGDLTLSGARLVVPGAEFVEVADIAGTLRQRGGQVAVDLRGRSLNGPVTARARLDAEKRQWNVSANAAPTVAGLAQSLGTTGGGTLQLRATAGGWDNPVVNASVTGSGELAGVKLTDLSATYDLHNKASRLRADVRTQALGEAQRLTADWTLGGAGRASVTGRLLNEPLKLQANARGNDVRVTGAALGGPLSAAHNLGTRAVSANVDVRPLGGALRASVAGRPDDLRLNVARLAAGGLELRGTGRLSGAGATLDLGALQLALDRSFRGTWRANGLSAYGVTVNGAGRVSLPDGTLGGNLDVRAPSIKDRLSGPVNVNWRERRGAWDFGRGAARWQAEGLRLALNGLRVAGLTARGELAYARGELNGEVRASGGAGAVSAVTLRGAGSAARLEARVRGVTLLGETRFTNGFPTTVRTNEGALRADLNFADGAQFDLRTGSERLQGAWRGGQLDAQGALDLAALRTLAGVPDLAGRVEARFVNGAGAGSLRASAGEASVAGSFEGGVTGLRADLTGGAAGARAALRGLVYPRLDLSGTLAWRDQTVAARLAGPYGSLAWSASGTTAPLSVGGVTLPAQALAASGQLTPGVRAQGQWGELKLAFENGLARVSGTQRFTALGQAGRLNLSARLGTDWAGELSASGRLGPYALQAAGPWRDLRADVRGSGPDNLRASARLNAATLAYQARGRGRVGGVFVDASARGQREQWQASGRAYDGEGGSANFAASSPQDWRARFTNLAAAGVRLNGSLEARAGAVSGDLRANGLQLRADDGALRLDGELAGTALQGDARLTLPTDLRDIHLSARGAWGQATLRGDADALAGSLNLARQAVNLAGAPLALNAANLPLRASLTPLTLQVGALRYAGGRFVGAQDLRYALGSEAGRLALRGGGRALRVNAAGPLRGTVQVWPEVRGELRARLAPIAAELPENVRTALTPGELRARLTNSAAVLDVLGTTYVGAPVTLDARVSWDGGLRASGALTHPGTRVPLELSGRDLRVRGARLDALALRPLLGESAQGEVRGDLSLPDLDLGRGSGQLLVNLRASGRSASGAVTLRGGQVRADLESDLGGRTLSVRGDVYPRADAALAVDGVRGSLRGDLQSELVLQAGGEFEGRGVDLRAALRPDVLTLGAEVAGARLNLDARRANGGWSGNARLLASDLKPLTGQAGRASATLSGTLARASGELTGRVAGADFTLPVRWQDGALAVQNGRVAADSGEARVNGRAYPTLDLRASADLRAFLPGAFELSATGPLGKPDLRATGTLRAARGSETFALSAPGSRVSARLLGQDWRLDASGSALSGAARGRLGAGFPLHSARFDLAAKAVWGGGQLRLLGATGWDARAGWGGTLNAAGRAYGQDANLTLRGRGALSLVGQVGRGRLRGELPATLPSAPGGTLALETFDLGALWGRGGQLSLSGTAALGGRWNALEASLTGRLADTGGDLGGALSGRYENGQLRAELGGDNGKLRAFASVRGGAYEARLSAREVALARLLPASLDVDALRFSGDLEARGGAGGFEQATLRDLDVQGRQGRIGAFSARGNLTLSPSALSSDLRLQALGGELSAAGQLPDGVRVVARGVDASALGVGLLGADVTLSGAAGNPSLAGGLTVERPEVVARADLGGTARDPRVELGADFRGDWAGRLTGELSGLRLRPLAARVRLAGAVQRGADRFSVDLAGVWPQLHGEARALLSALPDPLVVRGDGAGAYSLNAGALGQGRATLSTTLSTLSGFVPTVQAQARFTPLPLVNATGEGALNLSASGPVTDLQVAVSGELRDVTRSGVRLADLSLNGGGSLSGLALRARQGEREVAAFERGRLTVSGLGLQVLQSNLTLSGDYVPGGAAHVTAQARGPLSGTLRATLAGPAASASGTLTYSGVSATFEAAGSQAVGWGGRGSVTGLPAGVVTRDLSLAVGGRWNTPTVTGNLGLLGANARLFAGLGEDGPQARLALSDGPDATANGELRLHGGTLSGGAALKRGDARVSLGLSGTLSAPSAAVDARYGAWSAAGNLTPNNGRLALSDGAKTGSLRLDGEVLRAELPGLNLATLGLQDIAGVVNADVTYDLRANVGSAAATVTNARTPLRVPGLDFPVGGVLSVNGQLRQSATNLNATLVNARGQINLSAARVGAWSGQISANVRGERAGTLSADLRLADGLTNGQVSAEGYPLRFMGVAADLRGRVTLQNNAFSVDASANGEAGRVSLNGEGNLASVLAENLPELKLGLQPSDGPYRLDARLENLDLAALGALPHLTGRANANATLSDGGSTFVVRSANLRVAGEELPARLEGTSFGTEWRVRGFVGDSQLFGDVTGGVLSGRLQLSTLPVSALLGAFSGPLPGRGTVSGLARFTLPLADPLAGRLAVVAERIRVAAGSETLTGTGTLNYAARELRGVNVQLRGAGEWDVQGEFTRARVDLRAALRGTSFTPILALIPSVREAQPTLRGDLEARVTGSYDRPEAVLTSGGLSGSASGVRLSVAALNATLREGQLQGSANLRLEGNVAATATLSASGQLLEGQLQNARARYDGDFATRATGRLGRVTADLLQSGGGWNLDATIVQGGTARITGSLSPQLRLTASARGLTPQIGAIYARETSLNADLTVQESGADYVVGGAVTFGRLVIGSVSAPEGIDKPNGNGEKRENGENFVSPLPPELVTFPPPPGERRVSPLLARIVLNDIPVLTPNGIRIDENLARADLAGNLILAGRASEPRVNGQIRVVRGSLFLRENEFNIAQGQAIFDGSSAYPTFGATAAGFVPSDAGRVGVNVNVEGSFPAGSNGERNLDLRTTFACTSNCAVNGRELTESELYALVALGSPDITNLPAGLTQSALRTALNVFLLGEVERGVGRALGLDVFRIRTNLLSGAQDFGVQFTLGSYVTRDFYVEYQVDLTGDGLFNATYNTPDNRFTFTVSSPLAGLDFTTLKPSLSVGYNFTPRSSLQVGLTSGTSTTFKVGYTFRF